MGILFGAKKGDCPVAEDISDRLLRLPFYNDLEQWQQDKVIQAVRSFNKVLQS
jgi:dTDP-4-amino-4,6-dideoxygalactose transaminase